MKQRAILVEDLDGGEIVRLDVGLVRITHLTIANGTRCILLRDDLSETRDRIWVAGTTRVLEVLQDGKAPYAGARPGDEFDPVRR